MDMEATKAAAVGMEAEGAQRVWARTPGRAVEWADHQRRLDDLTGNLRELVGVVDRLTVQAQALAERVERLERWVSVPRPASELLGDGDSAIGNRQSAIGSREEDGAACLKGGGSDAQAKSTVAPWVIIDEAEEIGPEFVSRLQERGKGFVDSKPRTASAASGQDNTNPHETAAGPEQSGPPPVFVRTPLGSAREEAQGREYLSRALQAERALWQSRLRDEVRRLVRIGQAQGDIGRVSALYAMDRCFPGTMEIVARLLAAGKVLSMFEEDGQDVLANVSAEAALPMEDARLLMHTWRRFDVGEIGFLLERERVDDAVAMERIEAKRRAVGDAAAEGGAA